MYAVIYWEKGKEDLIKFVKDKKGFVCTYPLIYLADIVAYHIEATKKVEAKTISLECVHEL